MALHTASTRYLKALLAGKERFDLDGVPSGEVTETQREVASTTLRERFKKVAERRKAEARAQKQAEQDRASQQELQEKLAQLAARFNRG